MLYSKANLVILIIYYTKESAKSLKELNIRVIFALLYLFKPIIEAEIEDKIIYIITNRIKIEFKAIFKGTSIILGI
jgi:hypothetical protein